jgi:subtilisin family serine protease
MKHLRYLLFTYVLSFGVAGLFARDTEKVNGNDAVAKQAIVHVDLTKAPPGIVQVLTAAGNADEVRQLSQSRGSYAPTLAMYLVHSKITNATALLNIMKNVPGVTLVEPDYIVKTNTTPNDPNFAAQWDMYNTSTPGADIGATLAWSLSTGSTANVVGVVDTGVDYTHPDLAANIWSAPSQFTVVLSWGSITCPAGSHGYNAVARTCNPADDHSHGTHVSGTIGAIGNNGTGVAGVNWSTRIMGLKFLDSTGSGSVSDAIDAIEFGLQAKTIFSSAANLRVLSNSWGGGGYMQSLYNEIAKANTADVLFVAAAGNNASNNNTTPSYPASYTNANVIAVAATTNTDGLASFSNYGSTSVHLGAPGVNILSTLPGSAYGYYSGTSMATPHVSGAAMLVLSKCSLNTAGLKNAILSNVDVVSSLQGITITGGRLNVNRAIRSCATPTVSGAAAFVKTDTTTIGNWKNAYGVEGSNVINDSVSYPAYVAPAVSGNSNYTWAASTTDSRGLQKAAASDRIAACWYSTGSFSIDFPFTDSNTHQVALYVVDWDTWGGGRTMRIDIFDSNGNQLDSRNVSGFVNGQYLVWNFSGHVMARFTNTNPNGNAVVSGIFFGGAGATPPPAGTAAFLKTDTTTSGTWKGAYGGQGFNVINDTTAYPSYVTVTPSGNSNYTWSASTAEMRGLQKNAATDRIAACWYSYSNFTVDLAFSDSATHQVAFYMVDWDAWGGGRTQRVDILDSNGNLLDSRNVSTFGSGQYLVWNLTGHVVAKFTSTNSNSNAVVSGIFFGPGATQTSSATFVKTDTATSGTWKGVYGSAGYTLIGDAASMPSYAVATPAGNQSYTWAASTTDTRGLQKAAASDRIAACWYSFSSFSVDLTFTDSATHQVALYMVDWDNWGGGRTQRIDILDTNGNVLDSRSIASFQTGQYLVWNVSGHVVARFTSTNANSNAVLSGIFFQ